MFQGVRSSSRERNIGLHRWRKSAPKVGNDWGISIIEILMVALALAVLAGMGMPSLLRTIDAYRLRGAAWNLAGDLRLARQKAVSLQQRHRICFANCAGPVPARGYLLEREVPPWTVDVRRADVPDGLVFTDDAGRKFTFEAKGEVNGGCTQLTNAVGSYQIRILSSGRVLVSKGPCP